MVWCAREAADYPSSEAMLCHWHYGWIHWDEPTRTWHSITSLQLSIPAIIIGPKTKEEAARPVRQPTRPMHYTPDVALGLTGSARQLAIEKALQQQDPQQDGAQGKEPQ